jgi:hypothetical protein
MRVFLVFFSLIFIGVVVFQTLRKYSTYEPIEAADMSFSVDLFDSENELATVIVTSPTGIDFELKAPSSEEINEAQVKYQEKLKREEEERRRQEEALRREKMLKIEALRSFLIKKGSPMAPYSEIIYDSCMKYGAHYCKFFLSIAGIESGFGRVPLGCCNAWGIVALRWPSWEVSIPAASDWIARNYYLRGVDTFEELAYSSYGPVNPEGWIKNLYTFYNQIPNF